MHAGDLPSQVQVAVRSANTFWKDFRERAIATFWQGLVAVLLVAQPTTDWSTLRTTAAAALAGGLMAVLSMAKSLIARKRGVLNSASTNRSV